MNKTLAFRLFLNIIVILEILALVLNYSYTKTAFYVIFGLAILSFLSMGTYKIKNKESIMTNLTFILSGISLISSIGYLSFSVYNKFNETQLEHAGNINGFSFFQSLSIIFIIIQTIIFMDDGSINIKLPILNMNIIQLLVGIFFILNMWFISQTYVRINTQLTDG